MVIACIIVNLVAIVALVWRVAVDYDVSNRMAIAQDEVGVIVPEGLTAQFQGYDGKTKTWVNLSPRIFNAKYRILFEKEPKALEELKK